MKYLINDKEVHLVIFRRKLEEAIKDITGEEDFADWVDSAYLPGGISIGSGYYTAFEIISNDKDKSHFKETFDLYLSQMATQYIRRMKNGRVFTFDDVVFEIINED